ncbi:hypothetical protein [Flavobacterium psychrophilum]|uniref:hypothetical protein n=1 Tax=Flavobacterium psychrophilum TaxID=96345 RepID=UPI000B7C0EB0|nr:hypothetical protein [Flavobacterium psychrophilum]SNB01931.1 conserved hypothetical protein [Flavobacterium psychrophilum]
MKKLLFLSSVIFALIFFSCNEENVNSAVTKEQNQVMKFDSEVGMQNKINEIVVFKKKQELQIMEKILKRNNLKDITTVNLNTVAKVSNPTLDNAVIIEALTFYHTERLKAIYQERAHFNFTSIQSVADELNSLKFLNPKKVSGLFNEYADILKQSKYGVSTIFDSETANVINTKGVVNVNGKDLVTNSNNSVYARYDQELKEGIVAYDGIYAISWHAGREEHNNAWTYYKNFTQFASYINVNGTLVLYPSWFQANQNSRANFTDYIPLSFSFPTDYGSIVRIIGYDGRYDFPHSKFFSPSNGIAGGVFVTPIFNTFYTISGSVTYN